MPSYQTNPDWVMFDPAEVPPPLGVHLWVLTKGGRTVEAQWEEGFLAWAYFPKIPQSVKDRIRAEAEEKVRSGSSIASCAGQEG